MLPSLCPHCGDALSEAESAAGRCEGCGKPLASGIKKRAEPGPGPAPRPFRVSAESLENPFRGQVRAAWIGALICVGVALALAPFLRPPADGVGAALAVFGAITSCCCAFVAALVALVLRRTVGKVDQQLAAFRRGDYLIRWTYEPGEWRRFAEAERARGRWEAWGYAAVALCVAVVGLCIWITGRRGGSDDLLFAIITTLLVGFAVFVYTLVSYFSRASYRRALRRVGETYIGPQGVYFNGMYHTWDSFGLGLKGVQLREGDPAVLEVTIGNPSPTYSGFTLRVLVPAGHEEEARWLVKVFG
jgi:hypothetical protein